MSMLQLEVLRRLTVELEKASVADGYNYDLAGRVYRGRLRIGDDERPPLVTLLEPPQPPEPVQTPPRGRVLVGDWLVVIQGFAPEDPRNPADNGYKLAADIRRRLADIRESATQEEGILGLREVVEMHLARAIVRPVDEAVDMAFCWLEVKFRLAEKL